MDRKEYVEHAKHILEKSQTGAFIDFKTEYPDVQIKQRKFEALKLFFVMAAKEKDRRSCLCQKHVEIQVVLQFMKFRKSALQNTVPLLPVPGMVTEAVNATLCPKPEGSPYHHKLKCLQRQCPYCGVSKFAFLPEELSKDGPATKWRRYNYIGTGKFQSNGQGKKKIALITKETPPHELFSYFSSLLQDYPYHSFMAKWQHEQMDNLLEHLPLNEIACVHDYSESYCCRQQDEIQSKYFDVAQVSLHISVLYRHAVESANGKESTEDEPAIIKEHIFVISDDVTQDYDSVHKAQELKDKYLKDEIKVPVVKVH